MQTAQLEIALWKKCPNCVKDNRCYEVEPKFMEGGDFDIQGYTSKFHCECGERYTSITSRRIYIEDRENVSA